MNGMTHQWYLVKTNWPATIKRLFQFPEILDFHGLGGNLWPLDDEMDQEASDMSKRLRSSMEYLPQGNGSEELLCTNLEVALEYKAMCEGRFEETICLRVQGLASPCKCLGYDFGAPSGTYSIIESLILTPVELDKSDALNESGLFSNLDSIREFVKEATMIEVSEDMDAYDFYKIERI